MNRKSYIWIVVAAVLVALGLGAFISKASASETCVPQDAFTETIHHDAVTHVVHHDAITHVVHHDAVTHIVHHDAVTHTVHHDAVPAGPDLWWNWAPNHDQGPQDYVPDFPSDPRGTWEGPHENGGPMQDTYGTFQTGGGNSPFFHREHGTPGQDAYDEVVVDQEAYDETVVDQEAYDETVVDQEAYDETVTDQEAYDEIIKHPAVTCNTPPEPPVVVIVHTPPTKPQFVPPAVVTEAAPPVQTTVKTAAPKVPSVIDAGL